MLNGCVDWLGFLIQNINIEEKSDDKKKKQNKRTKQKHDDMIDNADQEAELDEDEIDDPDNKKRGMIHICMSCAVLCVTC